MKSMAIFVAFLFFAFGAMATFSNVNVEEKFSVKTESIHFDNLLHGNYSVLLSENKPVIPYYTKTYVLPAGSRFSIDVEPEEIKNLGEVELKAGYIPAPPGYEIREGSYEEAIENVDVCAYVSAIYGDIARASGSARHDMDQDLRRGE